MQSTALHKETFKKGSKTYYNASRFFPPEVREEVYILYGFVRVADNLVDAVPQDVQGFREFKARYQKALGGEVTGDPIIDPFVDLAKKRNFDPAWTQAFLHSMELDLEKKEYATLEETLEYIYGSAEVIGLYMCALLGLPEEAHHTAVMMGRSMQYINFLRDIAEDAGFGRRYIPLKDTSLKSLAPGEAKAHPEEFQRFIRAQARLYLGWQAEAEKGYKYLPPALLAPVKTASDMYNWTAEQIMKDPFVVLRKKVKPGKLRIFWTFFKNRFYKPA